LWADRFEGALEDIFDLQDQVTASVVGAIGPKLEQAEIERARAKPTENLNAYDLYLRALPSYYALTRAESDEALRLLRQAIGLDPNYAVAKALAAHRIVMRHNQLIKPSQSETDEGIRLAREALDGGRDDPSVLWAGSGAEGGWSAGITGIPPNSGGRSSIDRSRDRRHRPHDAVADHAIAMPAAL
jgi:adenylate cyclase